MTRATVDGVRGATLRLQAAPVVGSVYIRGRHSELLDRDAEGQHPISAIDGLEEILEKYKDSVGRSAYQVALDNGFEGTEAEWLESLHGKDAAPVRVSSESASEFIANDNTYQIYTALSTALTVICSTAEQKYGSLIRVTLAEGGAVSGFTNATTYTGDDYSSAAEGETWEFSILDTHVIGKQLSAVE